MTKKEEGKRGSGYYTSDLVREKYFQCFIRTHASARVQTMNGGGLIPRKFPGLPMKIGANVPAGRSNNDF